MVISTNKAIDDKFVKWNHASEIHGMSYRIYIMTAYRSYDFLRILYRLNLDGK